MESSDLEALKTTSGFSLPEGYVDRKVPLPVAWDYHAENSPEHPLFVYEYEPGDLRTVNWRQGNWATHRAARIVQSFASQSEQHILDPLKPPIIGILALKGNFKSASSIVPFFH